LPHGGGVTGTLTVAPIASYRNTVTNNFVICHGGEYRACADGKLFCFANDLRLFYFDNPGCVELTVTHIAWPVNPWRASGSAATNCRGLAPIPGSSPREHRAGRESYLKVTIS
jgi:hypothetical protein